jgi:nitrogen-specific signal transduction histidine kinase
MRVLIITSERRWHIAIESILPKSHDVVTWPAELVDQNATILQAVDVCFVAAVSIGPAMIDVIRKLQASHDVPVFSVADLVEPEYEELAILAGARQVFRYPLRAKLILTALDRLPRRTPPASSCAAPFAASPVVRSVRATENDEILAVLRDFSRLLAHAVDSPNFLGEYLRRLREVLRSSRLILYLSDIQSAEKRLKCAFATGVDPKSFDAIRLTQTSGLPSLLIQRGSLVERSRLREDVLVESSALRELNVFGTEFAVPLSARDGFVGLLLVGNRIAGAEYSESELTLLFHLMEELGAAVRNAELHADLLRERTTFSAVLQALPIGCLVLRSDHRVLHANQVMRQFLNTSPASVPKWEDLPALWASGAYEVLHRRAESHEVVVNHVTDKSTRKLRIMVKPLESAPGDTERAVAITAVDITAEFAAEKEQALANAFPLLPRVGASLANEFRNLFTPFHVISQFSDQGTPPPAMMRILGQLGSASQRIQRRIDNLAYLAPEALIPVLTTAKALLSEARQRVEELVTTEDAARVNWNAGVADATTMADPKAISLALAELVLNGLEASTEAVEVIVQADTDDLTMRVRNTGGWRALQPHESHRPFTSTKNGVGIGLEVATRVAKSHDGALVVATLPNDTVEVVMRIPRNPTFATR